MFQHDAILANAVSDQEISPSSKQLPHSRKPNVEQDQPIVLLIAKISYNFRPKNIKRDSNFFSSKYLPLHVF